MFEPLDLFVRACAEVLMVFGCLESWVLLTVVIVLEFVGVSESLHDLNHLVSLLALVSLQ
jgi:hypothetical protein